MSTPSKDVVRVLAIRPTSGTGCLRALADVEVDSRFVLHGCRVIQQDGQRAWFSTPQRQADGRWFPVVTILDPRLKDRLREVVLAAWEQHQHQNEPDY
jgi:DNA-binding cell septation regulator SpoVG